MWFEISPIHEDILVIDSLLLQCRGVILDMRSVSLVCPYISNGGAVTIVVMHFYTVVFYIPCPTRFKHTRVAAPGKGDALPSCKLL